MEIRIHGRGGQGGVTCAKILAALYARLGQSVQAFGDYAGERSGAPIRAYVRASDRPVTNRNKVYRPDHVLVLDRSLLDGAALAGLAPGGLLLVNTPEAPAALAETAPAQRVATVDATAIARRHGIGTRSVVIVNTTMAGAFARAMGLPYSALVDAFWELGLVENLEAAQDAWDAVREEPPATGPRTAPAEAAAAASPPAAPPSAAVLDLVAHREGPAPTLRTGSWRSQTPRYVKNLSPCNAACPAGNDVVGFLQALATDGEEAAAEVLARTTPLPGVCGRVCPAFCMQGCNRLALDGAVHVRGLERWVADRVPVARPGGAATALPRRIAVVGGGPAGLAAAYFLLRHGHQATVFDAGKALGGVLRSGIPRYRLPREVLDAEVAALLELGVDQRCGERLGPAEVEELLGAHDGLLLATGQQRVRRLAVPGSELAGVDDGLAFLARAGSDAAGIELAGHVVVLGGGNTALDCARTALRRGARRVTIAYRRSREEMPAIAEEIEEAVEEGIEILLQRAPVAFHGDGRVEGVELAEVRLGEPDESGRRRPILGSARHRLPADLVLLALGQESDMALLPPGWTLDAGRVWSGGAPLAAVAAGDLATGEGTVAHAIGDGRRAAAELLAALGEPVAPWRRPDPADAVTIARIRRGHFGPMPPGMPLVAPADARRRGFGEVSLGLQSAAEARRCLACGDCTRCDTCLVYCPEGAIHRDGDAYAIDLEICKGCGICVAECPRAGMEMTT